jgi:hypothetical protein
MFPVVAFPLCAAFALVGEVDPEATVLDAEIQMEVLATRFDAHPPVIMGHLLQVNERSLGDDFIQRRSSIWQLTLRPDLERVAVLFPRHAANLKMENARPLRGFRRFS